MSAVKSSDAGLWLTLIACIAFLMSICILIFGYGKWTRSTVSLNFTHQGVEGVGPYNFLKVDKGLMGTSIIRSLTGPFIIVPTTAISREELSRVIAERKQRDK